MKKLILGGLVLILTAILLPAAVLGASENEVNAAQKMAQYWVDSIAIEYAELAQWQGAVAIYPQPYENLDGDVNAYMFTIAGDKGIVGYILVGSSQYDYAIFEAGSVKPPARPSIDEACLAIEALGISTEGANLIKPVKLLYLGLDNQYALYNVNGQQVAVNLVFKNADSLSNLEPTLPSPSEYHEMIQQTSKRATRDLSGADSDLLTMYYYNDAGTNRVWCGPCSGVSILRYFRDYEGYSDLSGTDYVLYDLCYIYMDCASHNSSTLCTDYGDGIINTAGYYDYDNFNAYLDSYVTFSDYECVVNDISSDWPTALLISAQNHWRAIRGYIYDTSVSCYYVICTNSATSDSMEYINWLTMGYWNHTVAIKDNG